MTPGTRVSNPTSPSQRTALCRPGCALHGPDHAGGASLGVVRQDQSEYGDRHRTDGHQQRDAPGGRERDRARTVRAAVVITPPPESATGAGEQDPHGGESDDGAATACAPAGTSSAKKAGTAVTADRTRRPMSSRTGGRVRQARTTSTERDEPEHERERGDRVRRRLTVGESRGCTTSPSDTIPRTRSPTRRPVVRGVVMGRVPSSGGCRTVGPTGTAPGAEEVSRPMPEIARPTGKISRSRAPSRRYLQPGRREVSDAQQVARRGARPLAALSPVSADGAAVASDGPSPRPWTRSWSATSSSASASRVRRPDRLAPPRSPLGWMYAVGGLCQASQALAAPLGQLLHDEGRRPGSSGST